MGEHDRGLAAASEETAVVCRSGALGHGRGGGPVAFRVGPLTAGGVTRATRVNRLSQH